MNYEQFLRMELIRHYAEERRSINTIKDSALRMISELKHLAEMNATLGPLTDEEKGLYVVFQHVVKNIYIFDDDDAGDSDA